MRVTPKGLVDIKSSEGFSSKPYLDRVANPPVWTQGYGETKNIGPNSPLVTKEEAEQRLIRRFEAEYAWALEPFVELDGFTQNMYDALASFIWNCGPGAVGTQSTIGRRLRARDWPGAADGLLQWNKNGAGQVVPGLTTRRQRERALFLTPVRDADAAFLTKSEREAVAALALERKVAAKHGGWDKVDPSHLKNAARAKSDLRRRVELLAGLDGSQGHRRQRIAALKRAIAGGG